MVYYNDDLYLKTGVNSMSENQDVESTLRSGKITKPFFGN